VLSQQRREGFADKGRSPCEHLEEDDRDRVEICASIDVVCVSFGLLRGHVGGGANTGTCLGDLAGVHTCSDAKVDQFDELLSLWCVREEDVGRFDIPVDDALGVDVLDRCAELFRDVVDSVKGKTLFLFELVLEVLTFEVLHDEIVEAFFFEESEVDHAHDVGVIE